MEIKNKKSFNNLLKKITLEIVKEEELELDEITTTGDVEGYMTPFAFGANKRKNKKISTNSTGYKPVNEGLDNKDIEKIKKIVRDVYADILRDMWIKRSVWKKMK